eukprot:TRINITY_DN2547_c1_g2_i1.p1 TRINITY_DN2547_c1_g2~~TRINITY_DN2547_c1_g2_i1.p1  ORF type:complete len:272 (-),score=50.65 TRINITY_DN2547_c1_g2_i1:19-777(-)
MLKTKAGDDASLARYIRAYKGVIVDAAYRYDETNRWRQLNACDAILSGPVPLQDVWPKVVPAAYGGMSKQGCPLYIEHTGLMDMKMVSQIPEAEIVRRHIWHMEVMCARAAENSQKYGRHIEKNVHLLDLKGGDFGPRNISKFIDIIKQTTKIDQMHYPERMQALVIINAPKVFPTIWNMIKSFVDEETRKKIVVCGDDYKAALLNLFDPEFLPQEYGGTMASPFSKEVVAVSAAPSSAEVAHKTFSAAELQ